MVAWIHALALLSGVYATIAWEAPRARSGQRTVVCGALYLAPAELSAEVVLAGDRRGGAWLRTRPLAFHRDGSVRWLEVVGEVLGRRGRLRAAGAPDPVPSACLWSDGPSGRVLGSGGQARLECDGAELLWSLGARAVLRWGRLEGSLTGERGAVQAITFTPWRIEPGVSTGWYARYRLHCRGAVAGRVRLAVELDLQVLQGGRLLAIEASLQGADGGALEGLRLSFACDLDGAEQVFLAGERAPRGAREIQRGLVRLQVAPRRWRGGGCVRAGRIPGRLLLRRGSRPGRAAAALLLDLPHCARRWPRGYAIDGRGLRLLLLPGGGRLRAEERLTWQVILRRGDRLTLRASPAIARLRRAERRVPLPGFGGRLTRWGRGPLGSLEARLGDEIRSLAAWLESSPGGRRDYGDLPLTRLNARRPAATLWANLEYDPARGLALEWMRGGPPECLDLAEVLAHHTWSIDIPVVSPDARRSGLPLRHGADHRGEGHVDLGHLWNEGLLLAGRLSASQLCLEAAREMGAALERARPSQRSDLDLERTYAWPLLALAPLVEEGGASTPQGGLARWIGWTLACRPPNHAWFDFQSRRTRYSARSEQSAWLSGGLLCEALVRAASAVDRGRDRAELERSALLLADRIWEQLYDRSRQGFHAHLAFAPSAAPRAQGRLQGVREAYLLQGLLRVALSGRDQRSRDRIQKILHRRGPELMRLDEAHPWNDLSLLLRATPLLLGAW